MVLVAGKFKNVLHPMAEGGRARWGEDRVKLILLPGAHSLSNGILVQALLLCMT
jgi:hypothetical protein